MEETELKLSPEGQEARLEETNQGERAPHESQTVSNPWDASGNKHTASSRIY